MRAIQIISQDLFDKVRSRFSNLEMGDETGAVTIDPSTAMFFDFDFVVEGHDLGRVSISLADLGSLKIYYSQGITENQDDTAKNYWYDFLKEMRQFAMRRLLRFDTRDIAKTNLDKNDFQHLATTQPPKEQDMTTVAESRWTNKSTKKTSRAVKGRTQVVVRHTESMENVHASLRSHPKNIKAIFIENGDGERFKYPFIHLEGAFAMAQHVEHGGVPHDPAGKAIIQMSEQIAQLREFQRKVQRTQLHDDAMGITERAVGRLQELKAQVRALGKKMHYESWIATFDEGRFNQLSELDPVTLEDYKQKFTQTSFNEELADLFPLIHSIMQEKIDLEDYVEEERTEIKDKDGNVVSWRQEGEWKKSTKDPQGKVTNLSDKARRETEKKAKAPAESIEDFTEWADALEEGILTPDQVEALKSELEGMAQSGQKLDFNTAYEFFNQFGIDDPKLQQDFQAQADLDASADPLKTFRDWAADAYPDLLGPLSAVLPKAEPAAPQPSVENDDMTFTNNMMSSVSEAKNMDEVYHRVAEMVKSRYNQDNPTVGPFNGQEGILLDVEKEIKEKYGEEVGIHARTVAEKFMERLTQKWAAKHKPAIMGEKGTEEGMDEKPEEGNAYGQAVQNTPQGQEIKINGKGTGDIKRESDAELEAMSRHAKGWKKYGPGMKELAKAGKAGASEKEMDRIRKKHDRYDEEVNIIRKLAGM